ncbi:MAG: serine/threonine protein kinase [Elusimicrobiales bacterium]
MTDDLIRKTFAGCLVLEKIGQGGMGVVYKAHHIKLNKIVCIKLLPKELEADKRNIDFFLREAEISKQLDHPNTVHVYDYGRERDRYYIVMSYVEGKSLEVIVKEKGYLSVDEASEIMLGVMKGLEHAHSKTVIHRDIKPSNIIITKEGVPRIIDFGLARRIIEEKSLTVTGEMIGTAYFMSPEQGLGNKVDARSDLYSAGATYFYILTGKYPFEGNSTIEVISKHINSSLPNLYMIKPDLPIWTVRMIEKLMKKKPEERYQSATEVIAELEKHKAMGYKNILPETEEIVLEGVEDKIKTTQTTEKKQQPDKDKKITSTYSSIYEKKEDEEEKESPIKSKFQNKKIFILSRLILHSFFIFLAGALLITSAYISGKFQVFYILLFFLSLIAMTEALRKTFGKLTEYLIYFLLITLSAYGFAKSTIFNSPSHCFFKFFSTLETNPAFYIIASFLTITTLHSLHKKIKQTIIKKIIFALLFFTLSLVSSLSVSSVLQMNMIESYITIIKIATLLFTFLILISRLNLSLILFIAVNILAISMSKYQYISIQLDKVYTEEMKNYEMKIREIEMAVKQEISKIESEVKQKIYLGMVEDNINEMDIDKKINEEVKKRIDDEFKKRTSGLEIPQKDNIKRKISKEYNSMLIKNFIDMLGRSFFMIYIAAFLLLNISATIRLIYEVKTNDL